MNARTGLSRKVFACVAAALGIVPVRGQTASPAIRIGTYDSRAIAVAYARSGIPARVSAQLAAERDRARAAGDEKRARELEARGKAQQTRLHEQGFSTGSVAELMEQIRPGIPAVARAAGVALVVSKWEVVYKDPAVEYVDVTMPLVRAFSTDPRVLTLVEELMKHDPIPIDQLPPDLE